MAPSTTTSATTSGAGSHDCGRGPDTEKLPPEWEWRSGFQEALMDSASAAVDVGDSWGDPATVEPPPARPAAILRGNARGLEIVVDGSAPVEAIADAVTGRLDAAPGFFRGTDVRIRV